jgi:hypothetical protein
MTIHYLLRAVFILFLGAIGSLAGMWTSHIFAQEKKTYDLTETQTLRLKVKQLEYVSAFEHYQQAVGAFNAEVKAVEKEHDWPETVQFDPNTLTFHEPPPVRDEPAQGKPPSPKKQDLSTPTGPPVEPAKKP